MLKVCSKCGEDKEIDEFYIDRSKLDGHHHRCKECDREKNFQYYHNGGFKEVTNLARDFLKWLATEQGCIDCTERYRDRPEFLLIVNEGFLQHPELLTYDHVRGEKKFKVSDWHGYSLNSPLEVQKKIMKRLQDETKKCEIVCHNCHSIRTKRDWYIHNKWMKQNAVEREHIVDA